MAITGVFEADFSKFKTAVEQANVSLKGFQTSSEKVEAQLSRVGDSFSGVKVIQQAALITKAIEDIGGASALTAAEQKKVNATITEALDKYAALGQQAPPGMRELADATKQVGESTEKSSSALSGFVGHYLEARVIWDLAKESYRALVGFVTSSVEVYANAEAAARRLSVAVQTQGFAIPGLTEQYKALGVEYEKTTTFSHTAVEGAEALFVQLGNVGPDMMGRALEAATNLSAGLGIDLDSAVKLLSKAFEGHTTALARYGIILDDSRVKAEGMGYVLDAIQGKVGGQAQAEIDTYAGKIKQLGNAWDDLKESVGKAIVEDVLIQAAINDLKGSLDSLGQDTETYAPKVSDYWVRWTSGSTIAEVAVGWINAADEALRDLNNEIGRMKPPTPSSFQVPDIKTLNSGLDASTGSAKVIADLEEAWKKAAEAAKKYAEQVAQVASQITGENVAKKVHELADALTSVQRAGPLSAAELQRVADAAAKLFHEGARLPPLLLDIAIKFNGLLPPVKDGIAGMGELGEKMGNVTLPNIILVEEEIDKLSAKIKDGFSGVGTLGLKVSDGFKEGADAIDRYNRETIIGLADLSRAFQELGSSVGGDLGQIISTLGQMTNAVKLSFKSFSDASAAFTDGNTLAGIASMASGIMGIASAAIAAGKAIWDHLFGSAGRDAVTTFAASLGGFDVLQKKLEKLGAAGQQLWINLTQGVGKNDPGAAKKAIDAVNAALDAQATKIATVQSQIEALGGTTGPTYTQLTDLQKKYNLTAAQMGPSFQTASVHSSFQSLIDDMDELTRGGADVNAALFSVGDDGAKALSGLGTAIQGDIQASEQAGVDIPENLKTAAKALFDQGQLLDANGKKVTDFSTVKFGETMQTSLDNLNKTLKDLVNALTGSGSNSLSGALETIGNKTVSPRIKPIYDSSGLPQDYQSPSTYRTPSPTSAAPAGGSSMQVQLVLQDGRMLAETVVPYIPSVADSLGVGIHR